MSSMFWSIKFLVKKCKSVLPMDFSLWKRSSMVKARERFVEIGHTNGLRILLVVWTPRGNRIRPVTAFPPDRRTRDVYLRERF